jgi:hypothetical protein
LAYQFNLTITEAKDGAIWNFEGKDNFAWDFFYFNTPEQNNRLNAALAEVKRRLNQNNGKNPCAEFFGGLDKASKALDETKFRFGKVSLDRAAQTIGNTVKINPTGEITDKSGSVSLPVGFTLGPNPTVSSITLGNVEAAAFLLLHELGHRTKRYGSNDNDAGPAGVLNNGLIQEACFNEVTPVVRPGMINIP